MWEAQMVLLKAETLDEKKVAGMVGMRAASMVGYWVDVWGVLMAAAKDKLTVLMRVEEKEAMKDGVTEVMMGMKTVATMAYR